MTQGHGESRELNPLDWKWGFSKGAIDFHHYLANVKDGIFCFEPSQPISVSTPIDRIPQSIRTAVLIGFNDAYPQMIGMRGEDILGSPFSDLFPSNIQTQEYLTSFVKNNWRLEACEYSMEDELGRQQWFSFDLFSEIVEDKVVRFWGTQRNATQQQENLSQLQDNERRLRRLSENLLDLVCEIDCSGIITYINPSGKTFLGKYFDDLTGTSIFDHVYADDRRRVQISMLQAMQAASDSTLFHVEYRMRDATSREIWVESIGSRLLDAGGKTTGMVVTTRDVTDYVQEGKLKQALYRISEAANLAQDLDALYLQVHQVVGELFPAKNFFIALHDQERKTLTFTYYVDECDNDFPQKNVPFPEQDLAGSLTLYVIKKGTPALISPEAFAELERKGEVVNWGEPCLDWLGVPLKTHEGRIIGAMVVQSYTEGTRYGERERDLLMFVSTQVAMAIERKRVQNALTNSETRQRAILNAIPDLMLLLNSKGEVIDYFTSSEDFLSLSPESFVGKAIEKIYPAAVAKKITSLIKKTLQTGQVQLHEYGIQLSGEEKSFEARISACGPDTAVTIIRDITEDRKNDEALRQLNEKLTRKVNELEQHNREALLLNKMGDMLQSCLASEEAYVVVQQYGEQIFPDHSGALFMLNPSKNVLEAVAEWGEDLGSQTVFVPENCWGLRRGRTHTVINPGTGLLCRHVQAAPSNGDKQPYYCVPMSAQGETMGMLYLHGGSIETAQRWETLAVMVTEQIALALANLNLRDILQNQSIRDPLMNLFNRRYLQETMEREISRALRYSMPLGVIMADIDNFKRFNDTMGHDAGDTALKELGSLLVANTRKEDIACRYGGDEIAIILPGASLESTRERAEQIREAVKQLYIKYEDQPMVRLSMSFGVAACPEHGTTVKELLQAADTALYVSKDAGRDRVSCAAAPDGR